MWTEMKFYSSNKLFSLLHINATHSKFGAFFYSHNNFTLWISCHFINEICLHQTSCFFFSLSFESNRSDWTPVNRSVCIFIKLLMNIFISIKFVEWGNNCCLTSSHQRFVTNRKPISLHIEHWTFTFSLNVPWKLKIINIIFAFTKYKPCHKRCSVLIWNENSKHSEYLMLNA